MATNSVEGTLVGLESYLADTTGQAWSGSYCAGQHGFVGVTSEYYYTSVIKFTTPTYVGASESVTFTLAVAKGIQNSVTLRYAICTSDENRNNYTNTHDAVVDDNQITSGEVTFDGLSTMYTVETVVANTSKLTPNTTYYLILWSATPKTSPSYAVIQPFEDVTEESVVIVYSSGVIYIDNGTNFEPYQVYRGYLQEEKIFLRRHEAVEAIDEQWHYEVVKTYPNGGKDTKKVIDVAGVEAKAAWDEYEDIYRYIEYKEEDLNIDKETPNLNQRLSKIEEALLKLE